MPTNILLGIAVANFAIGLFVFLKNPKSAVNRVFFLFVFGSTVWMSSITLILSTHLFFFNQMIFHGATIMFAGLVLFATVFPKGEKPSAKIWWLLSPFLLVILSTHFNLLVKDIILKNNSVEPVNGPLMPFYAALMSFYVLISVILLISKFRKSEGRERAQIQYLFLGVLIFMASIVTFDMVLPSFEIFQLNTLGPISSVLFVGFTSYAIVRHQLMDIKIIIQRGVIYTALFGLIIAFYLIAVSVSGYLLQITSNMTVLLSACITVLAGIFGVPIIEKRFRKLTDKIFFKGKYDYSEALQELSKILNQNSELKDILNKSAEKLKEIFRVADAKLILSDQMPDFEDSGNIKIPILRDNRGLGYINLGPKLSGDAFTEEDFRLLRTFAYQAAVALEKAELYEKVKLYSQALEEKVEQRTAKIQQLQEEQKQMIIDISHNLQTPLTIIKGVWDSIKNKMPNKKLDVFTKSIDGVSQFIYDLLDLAHLEATHKNFKIEPINLSNLLKELVEYFEVLAKEKKIEIIANIQPEIIVQGKKDALEQLITNLVSNAVKYMKPKGERKILITLKESSEQIELSVEDTGIGISQEALPHVFNRFYRAKSQLGPDTKGSGLGLAICQKIAENHNGVIKTESALGKGTKFTVFFKKNLT